MKRVILHLAESVLGGLGLLWLLVGAYYELDPSAHKMGFMSFLLLGAALGTLWFFVDGLWVSRFVVRSIEITSNAIDTPITIRFGDLFAQDGFKVISVNDFFDSTVDEAHVSSNSLHGAMLKKYWAGNTADWDRQVKAGLSGVTPIEAGVSRPVPGKQERYPIGTTVKTSADGQSFLCVALTKTNTSTLQVSASSDDLHHSLRSLLAKARMTCSGRPLNIPLVGNGLGRTGIKANIIVDLILLAVFEESKKEKVTNAIRIILPKHLKNQIDLDTIQKDWR